MYTQIWNKYLPIIRILMKRAVTSDQLLDMNVTDFERSGVARKSGYKFTILFNNGRLDNVISSSPLAKDLSDTLLQDPVVKELLSRNNYQINMTTKFQLGIKYSPREPQLEEAVPAHQEASEASGEA